MQELFGNDRDGGSPERSDPPSGGAGDAPAPSNVAGRLGSVIDGHLDELRRRLGAPRARVGAAAAALIGVVVAVVVAWPGDDRAAQQAPAIAVTTTAAPIDPSIVVHVAGAVRSPGLYRLAKGARVVDLLEAAGGPADDLDLDRTNLAEALADGARVWMPRRGQASPAVSGGVEVSSGHVAPVDINTATTAQLDTVTGIGPTLAAAIVKERDAHGPFRTVDDLRRVKGVGAAKLESIRASLTAG